MIAGLVLAAGGSSRFGRPKQLLRFHGKSLLRRTVSCAVTGGCDLVLVVLGAEAAALRAELEGTLAEAVVHPGWERGLGSSVRAGIEALLVRAPAVDGVLLLACDQPLLEPEVVRRLLAALGGRRERIVACEYADSVGIPALFGREAFPHLLRLDDREGAKRVLEAHAADVLRVVWPEGALDIDRPEDYEALLSQ